MWQMKTCNFGGFQVFQLGYLNGLRIVRCAIRRNCQGRLTSAKPKSPPTGKTWATARSGEALKINFVRKTVRFPPPSSLFFWPGEPIFRRVWRHVAFVWWLRGCGRDGARTRRVQTWCERGRLMKIADASAECRMRSAGGNAKIGICVFGERVYNVGTGVKFCVRVTDRDDIFVWQGVSLCLS